MYASSPEPSLLKNLIVIKISGAADSYNLMLCFGVVVFLLKVVRDPCQKITLLLLKSKSVRVIVPESCFYKRILIF